MEDGDAVSLDRGFGAGGVVRSVVVTETASWSLPCPSRFDVNRLPPGAAFSLRSPGTSVRCQQARKFEHEFSDRFLRIAVG